MMSLGYLSRGSRRAATPREEFGDALRLIGGDAGDHIGETLLRVEKPLSLALAISEYEQKMKFACPVPRPTGSRQLTMSFDSSRLRGVASWPAQWSVASQLLLEAATSRLERSEDRAVICRPVRYRTQGNGFLSRKSIQAQVQNNLKEPAAPIRACRSRTATGLPRHRVDRRRSRLYFRSIRRRTFFSGTQKFVLVQLRASRLWIA